MSLPTRFARRVGWGLALLVLFAGRFSSPIFAIQSPSASPSSEALQPKDLWLGMYLSARKIGYTSIHIAPIKYQNRPALEMVSRSRLKMQVLGSAVEQDATQRTIMDSESRPLAQTFDIASSGSRLHIEATYDYAAGKVYCQQGAGADVTKKTLTIPAGANLAGDTNFITAGKRLSVGQKLSYYYLEPLSAELQEAKVEILRREILKDFATGKSVETLVSNTSMTQGQMTSWETETGELMKSELALGPVRLIMRNETKAQALDPNLAFADTAGNGGKPDYVPPSDFAVATAITADREIADPRRVRRLKATIRGIPNEKLILSDARQQAAILPVDSRVPGIAADYAIEAEKFDASKSALFPVTDATLLSYVKKAPYLDTENPGIAATAKKLRGQEKNLYRIALTIRDWVSKHMTPDPSIGVPRSATDIFGKRRGVCRDYSTLYAALARAAGVPTRLCGGIVYAQGKFYYHAWPEVHVGRWITLDPTLYNPQDPVDYVDATHIKFAQGDVIRMFDVVAIVGKLKIAIQQVVGPGP